MKFHARAAAALSFLALVFSAGAQTSPANSGVSSVSAQVPHLIRFSGVAKDEIGKPLSGVLGITFALYKDEQGGAPLWLETQNVQADAAGHYTALLGSATEDGVPLDLFASGDARWLEVRGQGQLEQPRVLLVSVPYAIKAHEAETLSGRTLSDFVLNETKTSSASRNNDQTRSSPEGSSTAPPPSGPASFTGSNSTQIVSVTQSGTGGGLYSTSTTHAAVAGTITGPSNTGVYGLASNTTAGSNAAGVTGVANTQAGPGVQGITTSSKGFGIQGVVNSTTGGTAVQGLNNATSGVSMGVAGQTSSVTTNSAGVAGVETAATGQVYGVSGSTSSTTNGAASVSGNEAATKGAVYGVYGSTSSTSQSAAGVKGLAGAATGVVSGVGGSTNSASNFAAGVSGLENAATGQNFGVQGAAFSRTNGAAGVIGSEEATTGVVYGVSGGTSSTTSGAAAVNGYENATTGQVFGVRGGTSSATNFAAGVSGAADATSGQVYGVVGVSNSTTAGAAAVNGYEPATTGAIYGVYGSTPSTSGTGVGGVATATSGNTAGVYGQSSSLSGAGVLGTNTATTGTGSGVSGFTSSSENGANGVYGQATATAGGTFGVHGVSSSSSGVGVGGSSPNIAVAGSNQACSSSGCTIHTGIAGQFVTATGGTILQGFSGSSLSALTQVFSVDAAGNLTISGKLTKGSGSFKIDHPLDPANKYLSHSFVESPDMMNVYNGNITTDSRGLATVVLPEYFEALNRDFRYQLTVIGQFAQAIVKQEIRSNSFTIRTSKPLVKVSWQVTGIRHDAYADAYRIPVEEDKPSQEQGHFLHPELFGASEQQAIGARLPTPSTTDSPMRASLVSPLSGADAPVK